MESKEMEMLIKRIYALCAQSFEILKEIQHMVGRIEIDLHSGFHKEDELDDHYW